MPAIAKVELASRVTEICEQAAAGTGLEIVEVDVLGGGKARLVRIYIDKPGGISHADCELISDRAGGFLDEEGVMPEEESYTLEVSSPGVERKLTKARDFERFQGQKIKLSLREPIGNQKRWEGKLARFAQDTIELETAPGQVLKIPLTQVQKANLKHEW